MPDSPALLRLLMPTYPDVSQHPAVIWVAVVVVVIVIIAMAFPRVLGPVGKGVEDWVSARRRTAQATDDTEKTGLKEDAAYWRGRADAQREEQEQRDVLISEHHQWDYAALQQNPSLGPWPPLLPPHTGRPGQS